MLWIVAIVFTALWVFGDLAALTLGGVIHIEIVMTILIMVIRVLQGERVL